MLALGMNGSCFCCSRREAGSERNVEQKIVSQICQSQDVALLSFSVSHNHTGCLTTFKSRSLRWEAESTSGSHLFEEFYWRRYTIAITLTPEHFRLACHGRVKARRTGSSKIGSRKHECGSLFLVVSFLARCRKVLHASHSELRACWQHLNKDHCPARLFSTLLIPSRVRSCRSCTSEGSPEVVALKNM